MILSICSDTFARRSLSPPGTSAVIQEGKTCDSPIRDVESIPPANKEADLIKSLLIMVIIL